jgi:hypothetical protein
MRRRRPWPRTSTSSKVWRPIAETEVEEVFAIGAPWQRVAQKLELPERTLDVAFSDRTRRARAFGLPSGQQLIVTWHQASNHPPNASDVQALKRALGRAGQPHPSMPIPDREPPPPAARTPRRDERSASASADSFRPFWAQLTQRLQRERPSWRLGTPNGNDYPLVSPLPGARIKCNFPRQGLRVGLLLQSRDRTTNLRRLDLLIQSLSELQRALGRESILVPETLPTRTQARLAAYRPGTLDAQRDWPVFLDWFTSVSVSLEHALRTTPTIRGQWPP